MEKINVIKLWFITVFGAIGAFIAQLLGGWTSDMQTLGVLMVVDIVMGFAIAAFWKKSGKSITGSLNSISMWKGLCRKGVSLLIVLVAHQLDMTMGTEYIRSAVIIAFIVNELISIVENAGIMGVPIPSVITRAIEVLKKKEGDTNG
ncbi:MAG: toxin secretion/phage lysis holin [Herbinix sp.]|jgi:toxin secretion/phage lysis holin|nr:toxin secretion/phage lysis holin [Herbinix sp.]